MIRGAEWHLRPVDPAFARGAICSSVLARTATVVYRLVFGQPRQDDLVEYLKQHIPEDQLEDLVGRLKIDLSP
jgi:hypothetical protein